MIDRQLEKRKPFRARTRCLAVLSLFGLLTGCTDAKPKDVVLKNVAPKKAEIVKAESLPKVKFVNFTKASGVDFTHVNGAEGQKLLPETMGSGAAFFDADGDGDQDLFFVNSNYWPGHKPSPGDRPAKQAFYLNDGKGNFKDASAESGLDVSFYGMGVATGDYDNDGDVDLYLTGLGSGKLFKNDGRGRFEDATKAANAQGPAGWQTSAAFFDMENDGDLDLFICCYVNWTIDDDRRQDFQLKGTGSGRAYGPPRAFRGSLCALCATTRVRLPM